MTTVEERQGRRRSGLAKRQKSNVWQQLAEGELGLGVGGE